MKICPRCSLVDDAHRRVCIGCRRSLMAAPELERDEVLEQRALALAAGGGAAVPWGPALEVREPAAAGLPAHAATRLVDGDEDERGGGLAVATLAPILVPDRVPDDLGDAAFGHDAPFETHALLDHDGTGTDDAPNDAAADGEPDGETDDATPAGAPNGLDLARATRDRLVKMYDPRANAAVAVDAGAPGATRRARPTADATDDPARRRNRRRAVVAVLAFVVVVLGVRAASHALHASSDPLTDPTVRVEKLHWRDVSFGDLVAQFPGSSERSTFGDEAGGVFTHQRFDLPDISITVVSTSAASIPANDIAMRGVAERFLASVGGRIDGGSTIDTGWGTAYSAHGTTPDGESLVYVVRTNGALVEVRGDTPGRAGERALAIFERIVRSFQPD